MAEQGSGGDALGRGATSRLTRRGVLGAAGVTTTALVAASIARLDGIAQEAERRPRQELGDASPVASPLSGSELDETLLQEVITELASAGVAVFDDPAAGAPLVAVPDPGPVALLTSQVGPMVREAMLAAGLLGADLDALVLDRPIVAEGDHDVVGMLDDPLPEIDGTPYPFPSLLVAAYIETIDSPGAALVRRFRPDITIEQARVQPLPSLGLILFAAELAREHAVAAARQPGGAMERRFLGFQGGVCSDIQGFIDRTLNDLFSALTVDLGPSPLGQILGGIIDGIVRAGQLPIRAAIAALTKPVLDAIRSVAGVLGTVAAAVSAIRPWTIRLIPTPPITRLAVGSEPGLPGDVTCIVDLGGFDEWPPHVADCAAQSGVPLPSLKPENARCSWRVTGSHPDLILTGALPTALDRNARATMTYQTRSESEDAARGTAVNGVVMVTATIARPEIDNLKTTLSNLLFAQLPDLLNQFVRPIMGPMVDQLLGKIASLTDSRATTTFIVVYHQPPEPTAEPAPEGAGGSIFFSCQAADYPFPWFFEIDASSCDGTDWSGTFRQVVELDFYGTTTASMDQSEPIEWSFSEGDLITHRAGPFETVVRYDFPTTGVTTESYVVEIDLTIERTETVEGMALIFGADIILTVGGVTEEGSFTNPELGTPIPVVPGDEC